MFHEPVVEHSVEVKSSKAQVEQLCSHRCQHPQADDLTQSSILRPRGRVHVRGEDVVVSDVEHMIHGTGGEWRAVKISASLEVFIVQQKLQLNSEEMKTFYNDCESLKS